MNLSVIVEQRLKSDVLGNRERHLCLIVARRVIFGIGYTFGVVDVWTLLSQTLLQSDALTKQEFGSKKNLERTQGTFL